MIEECIFCHKEKLVTDIVYEDEVVIGSAWAKANGKFTAKVRLQNCDTKRMHILKAKVNAGTEDEAVTAEQVVEYNWRAPILDYFSMEYYVHGNRSKIALTGEEFMTKKFVYEYWPGTIFTFEVAFSDNKELSRVYIVSGAEGAQRELEAFYDETSGRWIATGQFSDDINYAPHNFYIRYVNKAYQPGNIECRNLELDADVNFEMSAEDAVSVSEEFFERSIICEDQVYVEELGMNLSVVNSFVMLERYHTEEELAELGFEPMEIEGETVFCKTISDPDNIGVIILVLSRYQEPEEVSELDDELVLMSFGEQLKAGAELGQDVMDVTALFPDSVYKEFSETFKEGMSDGLESAQGVVEFCDEIVGISESIKDVHKTWLDTKLYSAEYDEIKRQVSYLNELSSALKSLQSQNPTEECLMYNANAMVSGLDDLNAQAQAIYNKRVALRVSAEAAGMAVDLSIGRTLGVVGKAGGKVVGAAGKQASKAVQSTMGKFKASKQYQERVGEFVEDKITSAGEDWIDNQLDSLQDGVTGLARNAIEGQMNELSSQNSSINGQLSDVETALNNAIRKCRITPTPTPTPEPPTPTEEPDPTEGPTPTRRPSPTSKPRPTTPPTPDEPDDPGDDGEIEGAGDDVTIDPSGYVYAGVRSNRIEGVKATVYYRDEKGNPVFWNAEEYDQINPQFTSAQGNYCWMVPPGDWKVIYEIDGYETYETEWLPVPPPQTEVNINLMTTASPALQEVFLNEEYAYITFNMYVQTESVDGSALTVSDASGNTYAGTLEAVNPEEEAGVMLADTYKLVFDRKAPKAGDNCVIALGESVIGYNAKKSVAEKQELTCKAGVKGLNAEFPAYLPVGEAVTIPIQVEASSYEGMQLLVETEEAYIEVCSIGAINENGLADIVLKALRPGACDLRIKVADSEKMIDVSICCARAEDQALISYAENALAETQEETNTTTNWIWFAILAAALVLVAGTACVIIIKKNKTRKNQ